MQSHSITDFDRFNVHTKNSPEFTLAIQSIEENIEADEKAEAANSLSKHKISYKQLTIFYAFAKRDQVLAKKYSDKFKLSVIEGSFEHGEACNLLGNANFMAGGDNNSTPFIEALSIFEKLGSEITDKAEQVLLCINQGFAHRYIGLAAHRKSMYSKDDKEASQRMHEESLKHYSEAEKKFKDAIKIQDESRVSSFPINLDLMETLHLMGVRQTRQGQYTDAITKLNNAFEMEKLFNQETGGTHFLTYITMQSLGEAYLLIGENDKALEILQNTLEEQEKFYGARENIDIAKTLHFIGMAQTNKKNYPLAVQSFQESLKIKNKLLKLDDFMIQVTKNELAKTLDAQSDFELNSATDKKSTEEMSVTAFSGTLYGASQSPRADKFAGTSATVQQTSGISGTRNTGK